MTQQPKWKCGGVAVWDFGDRISIRIFDWNYISVPKNPNYKEEYGDLSDEKVAGLQGEVVNNVREESVPNGA